MRLLLPVSRCRPSLAHRIHHQIQRMSSTEAKRPSSPLSKLTFDKSPATPDPLGNGKHIQTCGCLIIGDEVLNGKTRDSNSNYLARFLFDLGIDLKRIEVIADDEEEIIEAARRMVEKYDFVVTSGGIGPTHDDITYQSIAKAFDDEGKLVYHDETLRRMNEFTKERMQRDPNFTAQTEEQQKARYRMALFPEKHSEVLFVDGSAWVPVVRIKRKLIILPGVPRIFEKLIDGMADYLRLPPASSKPFRHLVHTKMPESNIAPYLTELANRVKSERIRVGSYPKLHSGVDVSLIGQDNARLEELVKEVCEKLQGTVLEQGKL